MNRRREHWTPGVPVFSRDISEPLRGVGGLFLMSVDAVRFLFAGHFKHESSWSSPGLSLASQSCPRC